MAKKQKTFSLPLTIAACLLAFVVGAVAGFAMWTVYKNPKGGDVYVSGDLQIHFMELGNNYTGDNLHKGWRNGYSHRRGFPREQHRCDFGIYRYVLHGRHARIRHCDTR